MDRRSLYDEDIYAWAREQAEVLRRLAETGRDLPNELDLENVAEEIEDVGKSELSKVESFIRLILTHLLKLASAPQSRSQRKWRNEVLAFHAELLKEITPAMRPNIDVSHQWRLALLKADGDLSENGDELLAGLPSACPFSLDDLTEERFEIDRAVKRSAPLT
jgi:Domain of unknown function DUF29